MVNEARIAAEKLAEDGIDAEVINIHTIKPLDEKAVIESAKKTGAVVVVEEHSVVGGLVSAVCDVLAQNQPTKVKLIGMNDEYGMSGSAADLLEHYGFSADNIVAKVKEILK